MIVIIERISPETQKQDLIDFIQPALKGNIFQKSGQFASLKIISYTDKLTGEVHYYGTILIPSDTVAQRVIRKLNNTKLLDELVVIRKYHFRSWRDDPRVNGKKLNPKLKNSRKRDRRQSSLEDHNQTTIESTGHKDFSRSRL